MVLRQSLGRELSLTIEASPAVKVDSVCPVDVGAPTVRPSNLSIANSTRMIMALWVSLLPASYISISILSVFAGIFFCCLWMSAVVGSGVFALLHSVFFTPFFPLVRQPFSVPSVVTLIGCSLFFPEMMTRVHNG
jgi:hypothetical protein